MRRVTLVALVLLLLAATAWAITYGSIVHYATQTSGSPRWVAVGSFRGNGVLDLAVADIPASGNNSVSVFLGNGDGTFAARSDIDAGTNTCVSLALGDLRQNGTLDIVTSNYASNTVSVLLGNGDGTFAAKVTYGAGGFPFGIALGSLSNNGKIDIVTCNPAGNTISVLLGNGDGTFGGASTYATGLGPECPALADFNGDGFLDVVVSNTSATTVSVLLGNGLGAFGAKTDFSTGTAPAPGVAVGDLRGNGKLDLVVGNGTTGSVVVLLGNGDGTFAAKVDYTVGFYTLNVVLADIDGDGKLDVTTRDYTSVAGTTGGTCVLLGNGDGTFGTATAYGTTDSPSCITVGDFDGDGKLDLATSNYSAGSTGVSVLLQTTADSRGEFPGIGGNLLPLWKNTKVTLGEAQSGSTGKTVKGE